MVDEPGESTWRVRMGAGLLSAAPLNDSLREAHRKEDERDAQRAEFAAQLRADAELERNAELLRLGHTPRTQQEFLAQVGWAQDRQDAIDAKRVKAGDEQRGNEREPRLDKYQMLADAREREAKAKETPATQAELSKVAGKIASLANSINLLKRRL